ncbi:hypothetical protein [Paracoccus litorisediminis]|uniref:Uncharacterized protein n=1 Tax=Paracoccus litorisediminis TaxID=2006130 RepID=A0A844HQ11_9RHOB|nr:hypothetical protein [Paracoccus litorisediminis]MTH61148.1 hypothetical protein [Paracoccus litorisediminis]
MNTTQIRSFGRVEHGIVSAKVLAALKTLESELGVKFDTAGGMVGQGGGHIKLTVDVQDNGTGLSGAESEFRAYCITYGLKPEWFGQTFWSQGVQYRVTGLKISRPKFPIEAVRVKDGAAFKFGASTVRRAIEGGAV